LLLNWLHLIYDLRVCCDPEIGAVSGYHIAQWTID